MTTSPAFFALAAIVVLEFFVSIFLTIKYNCIMASFEDLQATVQATNTALDNIGTEMTGMKSEIEVLKEKLGNMGLTAEQEQVIGEGLASLRARAEAISTVVEGNQPEDNGSDEE